MNRLLTWLRSVTVQYTVAFGLAFMALPCVSVGLLVGSIRVADLRAEERDAMFYRGFAVAVGWLALTMAIILWLSFRARNRK